MAASLTAANMLRALTSIRTQILTSGHWRLYATSCKELDADRQPRVAMAPDKSCIICWHPEPEFPYDCTQPLPRNEEEAAEGESPLKVNLLMEEKLKMRADGPTDHELCNMFFTTKHTWRPMPGKKYRKPNLPLDREGL
ncbi:large ribosomal subunit protein mL42-like [Littorina saxatilis]|uniref:Large ribosomal subunit protein mL42 n=1 Tax=Littorina saxatilis TaxID=31220 RepID=A0AAN9BBU9_9CAEN